MIHHHTYTMETSKAAIFKCNAYLASFKKGTVYDGPHKFSATTVASIFLSWRGGFLCSEMLAASNVKTGTPPSHQIFPRMAKSVAKHEKDARFPARHRCMVGVVWRHHKIGCIIMWMNIMIKSYMFVVAVVAVVMSYEVVVAAALLLGCQLHFRFSPPLWTQSMAAWYDLYGDFTWIPAPTLTCSHF